ncbi:ComF family protein [Labilibaculum euxinus]|uniref:ComF family protein n=1 Tax=Labilibaculum euxinus TaxID=2686357 RepID=A0A7M4D2H8_9BACT|nr:ComF family protein [Labilibaculum euxinus]MUP36857.1 ComF family protein [Labilibaculum euxinus]MVB06062.1 ComF family protein [Labilibaculum euxinus]
MTLKLSISTWFNDFLNLFYPRLCEACGSYLFKNETTICTRCLFHLPKTDFHLNKNNPVSILFWGRVNINYAASYYTFSKGSQFQKLIHKLKYHNKQEIGIALGKHFGESLKNSEFFKDIDVIIPVPLHPKKEKIRGYNQAELVALGLGKSMLKPTDSKNLIRKIHTESQTKKNKLERWQNVDNIFELIEPSNLINKHILLVDDVVTTGSTLEACAHALLKAEGAKVSIATLAYA